MGESAGNYEPLDTASLPGRLASVEAVASRLGRDFENWRTREVGDGNLNLVFIVESGQGAVVVKQALPYVRLVGDSWPLPLSRSFFEYHALTRQASRAPGTVPEVYHFDEQQAMIIMEYLSSHHILRRSLQQGIRHERLGAMLGHFCADTLFKGSDLYMDAAERKRDVGLFSANTALCDITESLVFTDPYYRADMNRHTSPQLDDIVRALHADVESKMAAQTMKQAFCSRAETMLHGDLHTGSVMVSDADARVIDPEFVLYGPMGFDIGMLIANFIMGWCSQSGYESAGDDRRGYRDWVLQVIEDTWVSFESRFTVLWRNERKGILFPAALFEDQDDMSAAEMLLARQLEQIWNDAMGFCGCEINRRILGLAHNADFEDIEDADLRAQCESTALAIARRLLVDRSSAGTLSALRSLIENTRGLYRAGGGKSNGGS